MSVFGFYIAGSFGNSLVNVWHSIADNAPKWLVALAIVFVSWLLAKLVRRMVQRVIGRTSTQGHVDILISRGAAALVLLAGVLVALTEVGVSFGHALAALGLASVGIGFALQDILSNLFAGVILLVQHPFTIGDQVQLGNLEGIVENIRVRDTQILTYEGERVFIPNRTVFSNPIVNFTSTPNLRTEVRVDIKYPEDIEAAKVLAEELLLGFHGVLELPAPAVLVEAKDDAMTVVMRFWIDSDRNRRAKVASDVVEAAVNRFRANGITTLQDIPEKGQAEPDPGGGRPDIGDTLPMEPVTPEEPA